MKNLPDKCPSCGVGSEWFAEDEDGPSAMFPTGFYCMNCNEIFQLKVETKPEIQTGAKANCSLFAQPDEAFAKHLEQQANEQKEIMAQADQKLAELRASMTDKQWEVYQQKKTQKHIAEHAALPEFWSR